MTRTLNLDKVQQLLDALDTAFEQQGNFHPVEAPVVLQEMFRVQRSLYLKKMQNASFTEDEKYDLIESLVNLARVAGNDGVYDVLSDMGLLTW